MDTRAIIGQTVTELESVSGVKALVLGGSYATGTQRPDSDIDLGLYYSEHDPPDIAHIKRIAADLNDFPDPVVTELGAWGPWVNGGAWLTIQGQRVDFLYRNADLISRIIDECGRGVIQSDYYQQPPYGFHSYIYCSEIQVCQPLYDPVGLIAGLKTRVAGYPPALKQKIVQRFLWDARFSLDNAKKFVARGQVYLLAGSITRVASDLVQVLYGLNETCFLSDKKMTVDADRFSAKPDRFVERVSVILSNLGNTPGELSQAHSGIEALFEEMAALAGELYKPRY